MNEIKYFISASKGIVITVPKQVSGVKVKVKKISFTATDKMKNDKLKFKFKREVSEIDIFDENIPAKSLQKFNPAIELRVYFEKSDLPGLDEYDLNLPVSKIPDSIFGSLRMAYWKGNKWNPFKEDVHQFKVYKFPYKKWAGYCVAIIQEWVDPPVALGE